MIRLSSPDRRLTDDADAEVARYDVVASGSATFRSLAEEAARIAGVPVALVSLMTSTSHRALAAVGTDVTVLDVNDTMCLVVLGEGGRVHVRDASQDERWQDNPFVDGRWADMRFLGVHPLRSPRGVVIGTLTVLDQRPRELAPSQVDALDALAERVVDALEAGRLAAPAHGSRPDGTP